MITIEKKKEDKFEIWLTPHGNKKKKNGHNWERKEGGRKKLQPQIWLHVPSQTLLPLETSDNAILVVGILPTHVTYELLEGHKQHPLTSACVQPFFYYFY